VIVELFTVTTGAIGEAIEIVTGDVAVAFADCRVTMAVFVVT